MGVGLDIALSVREDITNHNSICC